MTKDLHKTGDGLWLNRYSALPTHVDLGSVRNKKNGDDIMIISYANGFFLSMQAQQKLKEQYSITTNIVDLQWLHPLPIRAIRSLIGATQRILIVDECRYSGSPSERLFCHLTETLDQKIQIERITAHDSFIPLGDAAKSLLPSGDSIVRKVLQMVS